MSETLIAGIGSPFGADRLGWAVIDALQSEALTEPVRLLACRLPSELTTLLLAAPRAIVIDAMLGDGPVGTICQLSADELPQAALRLSSHGLGLIEAVKLAVVLGMPSDKLKVLALNVGHAEAELEPEWVAALIEKLKAVLAQDWPIFSAR